MSDEPLKAGDVLGERFMLESLVGNGSFGVVFRARDLTHPSRRVAVKVLYPHRRSRKNVQRFLQEARILGALEHPNLARFVSFGEEGEDLFIAMELVDGEPLSTRLDDHAARDRLIPVEALRWIVEQLSAGVHELHRYAVVHRDLKPRNIMVNRPGQRPRLKILDFGIAKILVGSTVEPTTVGRMVGSLSYVAPEQLLGRAVDFRTDVFSLAIVLFEVMTLRRPWAQDADGAPLPWPLGIGDPVINNHVALAERILRAERPRVTDFRQDLSSRVDEVLARALAVEPDQRYPTAEALGRAVRNALLGIG